MKLRYVNENGKQVEYRMEKDVTRIGRAPESEVVLEGEKVSRHHAAIRYWDGDFVLKDLRSRNGTFVNGQPVNVAKLDSGDCIKIGGFELHFEERSPKAPNTIIRRIGEEMDEGRGYGTIMRELVKEATPHKNPKPPTARDKSSPSTEE